jgi:hypothetical protein
MSRLPCRRRIAAFLGVACIATMPVALAGPAAADPPSPSSPTTTVVVPTPQQQVPQAVQEQPAPQVDQVPSGIVPQVPQAPAPPVQAPAEPTAASSPPSVYVPPTITIPVDPGSKQGATAPIENPPQPRSRDDAPVQQAPPEVVIPPHVTNVPDTPKGDDGYQGPQNGSNWQPPPGNGQHQGNPRDDSGNLPVPPPVVIPPHVTPPPDQPPGHQDGDGHQSSGQPPWQQGNDGGHQQVPPPVIPPPHVPPPVDQHQGQPPWDNPGHDDGHDSVPPSDGHQWPWQPPGHTDGDNGHGQPPWNGDNQGQQPWDGQNSGGHDGHDNCDSDCGHPVPVPVPHDGHGFPDWGNGPSHQCDDHDCNAPVPVEHHNPTPHCGDQDNDCHPGPVLPGQWNNQWLNDCDHNHGHDCHPPQNPDIFVHNDVNNNPVFVNNIVNTTTNVFVTNLQTGAVWNFPHVGYGAPFAFPPNWCGGIGGGFAWSANIGTPFFGANFAGGGYFNAGAGCGVIPYVPPPVPLIIAAQGYPQYIAPNYVRPPGCGCVHVANTYIFGQQQGPVFVPRSWTPDIVTQPARQGLPYFITGSDPSDKQVSALATIMHRSSQPLIWGSAVLIVMAIVTAFWVNRRQRSTQES